MYDQVNVSIDVMLSILILTNDDWTCSAPPIRPLNIAEHEEVAGRQT